MKVPPFFSGPVVTPKAASAEEDRKMTERHAAMIRAAWAKCGHDVETDVREILTKDGAHLCWAVRLPSLVNGLPTRRVLVEDAAA